MSGNHQAESSQAHANLVSELDRHRRRLMQLLSKLDVSSWPGRKAIPESAARRRFSGDPVTAETLLYNYRDLLRPVADHTPDLWTEDVVSVSIDDRPLRTVGLSLDTLDQWRGETITHYKERPGLGSARSRVTERVFLPPEAVRQLANQLLAVQQDLGLGMRVEASREGDIATGGRDEDSGEIDIPTDPWESVENSHGND